MENNISENFIDCAFRIGRLHGRLGLPEMKYHNMKNGLEKISIDSYKRGYDQGCLERISAKITNEDKCSNKTKEIEQFGGLPEEIELDINELSLATLKSYADKAEQSKKDHLQSNIVAKKPEVQKFHDRIVHKRHSMQQKAIAKLKT